MRVTGDKDYPSEFELLKAYYNMRWLAKGGTGFDANVSAHEKGIHVVAFGLPITQEQAIELRKWIGDDPVRISFDEDPQGKPLQVLYSKKGEDEIRDFLTADLLMKPFWSKLPKRH